METEPENIRLMINDLFNDGAQDANGSDSDSDSLSGETMKDLDTSWIQEHERLSSVNENYQRETMESIPVYFVYINRNQYIEKIISDKIPLVLHEDKSHSYITKEALLQIIQSRKIKTAFSKYKLMDVLSYLVDLEPEHIQSFSKSEMIDHPTPYFKIASIMDDIRIQPSIFIFHGLNAIYFLFEEVELLNHRHTLKSILKASVPTLSLASTSSLSSTKKVRIQEGNIQHSRPPSKHHRVTRKHFAK
jgi:hypothetical protein